MDMNKLFENLTEEQIALAKQCKSPEEFLKHTAGEDIELNDEQLDAVSGGIGDSPSGLGWSPDDDINHCDGPVNSRK